MATAVPPQLLESSQETSKSTRSPFSLPDEEVAAADEEVGKVFENEELPAAAGAAAPAADSDVDDEYEEEEEVSHLIC